MTNPTPDPYSTQLSSAACSARKLDFIESAVEAAKTREAEALCLQFAAMVDHDSCGWRTATARLAAARSELKALRRCRALPTPACPAAGRAVASRILLGALGARVEPRSVR